MITPNPQENAPPRRERKKPGPVPGVATRKYNILLPEELGEWGKEQPGGLSELVRRLLQQEQKNRTQK